MLHRSCSISFAIDFICSSTVFTGSRYFLALLINLFSLFVGSFKYYSPPNITPAPKIINTIPIIACMYNIRTHPSSNVSKASLKTAAKTGETPNIIPIVIKFSAICLHLSQFCIFPIPKRKFTN